jgi:hypothetical protein
MRALNLAADLKRPSVTSVTAHHSQTKSASSCPGRLAPTPARQYLAFAALGLFRSKAQNYEGLSFRPKNATRQVRVFIADGHNWARQTLEPVRT